jgi:hypothetical protein
MDNYASLEQSADSAKGVINNNKKNKSSFLSSSFQSTPAVHSDKMRASWLASERAVAYFADRLGNALTRVL